MQDKGEDRMVRTMSIGLILTGAFASVPAPAGAQGAEAGLDVTVPSGEVREGDLYAAAEVVRVDGRLAGDLVALGQRVLVDGEVDGDLIAAGRAIDLRGPVGDATRVAGDQLTFSSAIDGDLVAAGNRLQLLEDAVVRGRLMATGSIVEVEGTVEEDLRVAAGEIIVRGTVRGDARVMADRLELAPGARIDGDLDYRTRTPLSAEEAARVGGAVRHREPVHDEDSDRSWVGRVFRSWFWGWQLGSALLIGLLAVALSPRVVQQLVSAIAGETTLGALLGFGAFLIVPIATVVVMLTVVGVPLGLIVMLLFGAALYLAKLPAAAWVGERLLANAGRPDPSPYAAMAIGVLVLYLLFAVPWLGGLCWLAATWLGLGAMVLTGRRYLAEGAGQESAS